MITSEKNSFMTSLTLYKSLYGPLSQMCRMPLCRKRVLHGHTGREINNTLNTFRPARRDNQSLDKQHRLTPELRMRGYRAVSAKRKYVPLPGTM
jgi:hypothetical protein